MKKRYMAPQTVAHTVTPHQPLLSVSGDAPTDGLDNQGEENLIKGATDDNVWGAW